MAKRGIDHLEKKRFSPEPFLPLNDSSATKKGYNAILTLKLKNRFTE